MALPSYTATDAALVAQKAPGVSQTELLRRIYEYFTSVNAGTAGTVGVSRTAAFSSVTTGGTVAAGAKSVSFTNVGSTAGTVAGGNLAVNTTTSFVAPGFDTLGAIIYVASATAILQITTVV